MNSLTKFLKYISLIFLFLSQTVCSQTLTVGQVHGYAVGDVICTRIGLESGLPNYKIDTIVSRKTVGADIEIIKQYTLFVYNAGTGKWIGTSKKDTTLITGLNNPYFNRFLSKDSLSVTKDSSNNNIAIFEIKDSTFKDPCNRQANYSRYYNWKKTTGSILQTITVYEKLGIFFHYEQLQSTTIILDETPQFYIISGQFCGDSSVLKSFRNVSVQVVRIPSVNVWPNPIKNVLNIAINEPFNFEFIDYQGRSIFNGNSNSNTINTELLPSGLYILKIHTDNGIYQNKILKE